MRVRARSVVTVVLAAVIPLITGCGQFSPFYAPRTLNIFGAKEMIRDDNFEQIDLVTVLDLATGDAKVEPDASGNPPARPIEKAFARFYEAPAEPGMSKSDTLALRRNRVQERLLAASEQRCEAYKRFLNQFSAEIGLTLGSLTTALGGVGAIVTGVAPIMAGAAAVTSGINAEFDERLFSRLTIQVLAKGLQARRDEIYKEILERRKATTMEEYPVEAAIRDALRYHGACSLRAGLEKASTAIDRTRGDVGLARVAELLGTGSVPDFLQTLVLRDPERVSLQARDAVVRLDTRLVRLNQLITEGDTALTQPPPPATDAPKTQARADLVAGLATAKGARVTHQTKRDNYLKEVPDLQAKLRSDDRAAARRAEIELLAKDSEINTTIVAVNRLADPIADALERLMRK